MGKKEKYAIFEKQLSKLCDMLDTIKDVVSERPELFKGPKA